MLAGNSEICLDIIWYLIIAGMGSKTLSERYFDGDSQALHDNFWGLKLRVGVWMTGSMGVCEEKTTTISGRKQRKHVNLSGLSICSAVAMLNNKHGAMDACRGHWRLGWFSDGTWWDNSPDLAYCIHLHTSKKLTSNPKTTQVPEGISTI